METEILIGAGNRFDAGLSLGTREVKALRDLAVDLLGRVILLETRAKNLEPKPEEKDKKKGK